MTETMKIDIRQIQNSAKTLRQIAEQIDDLVCKARNAYLDALDAGAEGNIHNADAYVFEQIREHIENGNPYNQSLNSLAEALEDFDNFDEDEE